MKLGKGNVFCKGTFETDPVGSELHGAGMILPAFYDRSLSGNLKNFQPSFEFFEVFRFIRLASVAAQRYRPDNLNNKTAYECELNSRS